MTLSGALTNLLGAILLVYDPGVGDKKAVAVFASAFDFHAFPPSENMKIALFQKFTENGLKTVKIQIV